MASLSLWEYFKDKLGGSSSDCLRHYYPELIGTDVRLQQALAMIDAGDALIEKVIDELEWEEDEANDD